MIIKHKHRTLVAVVMTAFLDMLGVGIIIPIMPALFFEPQSAILPATIDDTYRSILFGLLIGCYPFMQFFGAPVLGALSDRYGRKPLLALSNLGVLAGYLLFAWSIIIGNLWLMFFSRMLPGFAGGNVSIAMSSVADVSEGEEEKTKNFGLVGMAFGIGFILGPALGGILGDSSVVAWFRSDSPFWFAAILAFANLLVVQFFFPETLKESGQMKAGFFTGFRNIGKSFNLPGLRGVFTVVLLLSIGFSFFTQFFSVYLIQKFSYSEKYIGFLYGWVGLWFAFTQGGLVPYLSRWFRPRQLLSVCIILLSLALAANLLPGESGWLYLLTPLVAISQGIIMPNMTSVISSRAGYGKQGEVLGINQSMQSLGEIIPPFIAGYLNALNINLPLLSAAVLVFVAWLIYMMVARKAS